LSKSTTRAQGVVVTVKVPDHRSLIHSPLDAGKMVLSERIGTINATSARAAGVEAVRPPP
jgi:predicted dehydrogenase